MSLRLLIDEDSQAQLLIDLLRKAGHNLVTVNEADLTSQPDLIVLDYARKNNRIVLTRNCEDFEDLHLINSNHPGIFVIYFEIVPTKRMSYSQVVKAIGNIETAQIPIANQFIVLNQWKY